MNKKAVLGFLVLTAIALIVTIISNLKSRGDSVVIGAILPLTGIVSADGEESRRGIMLAYDELKRTGAITNGQFVLKVEDGKYTTKDTLSAYKKLKASGLDGLLLMGELPCEVLANDLQQENLPTVATILGSDKVLAKSETYVRAWMPICQIGNVMASFAIEKLMVKSAATLYVDTEFGLESKIAFEDRFKIKGHIVGSEKFSVDDRDVRNVVSKILSLRPDAVYVTGFAQGYVSVMNQLREMGFEGPILTDMGIAAPQVYKNVKALGNIYFVSGDFGPDARTEEYKQYRNVYFSQYHEEPKLISAMHYFSLKRLYSSLHDSSGRKNIRKNFVDMGEMMTPFGTVRFDSEGEIHLPIIIYNFSSEAGLPSVVDSEIYKSL